MRLMPQNQNQIKIKNSSFRHPQNEDSVVS